MFRFHKNIIALIGIFVSVLLSAQEKNKLETLSSLPNELSEISGIVPDGEGNFWAINDSDNEPAIYKVNLDGQILKKTLISNAKNVDWEDLAKDKKGNIYIADLGNNYNNRKDQVIYKVKEKMLLYNASIEAEKISISFKNQKAFPAKANNMNFDIEALIHDDKGLVLFTKNRTKPYSSFTYAYRFPDSAAHYNIAPIDSFNTRGKVKETSWVTAATISPNSRHIVLLSHNHLWIFSDFYRKEYFSGYIQKVELNHFSQKESVCFINDSTLLIADERQSITGQKLYSLNISPEIAELDSVRKWEARVFEKEFNDSLKVDLDLYVKAPVYFELYDTFGKLLDYDKIGLYEKGKHQIVLTPTNLINSTYLLSILVGNRPHAFLVYKFKPFSKEQEKEEILKLQESPN